MHESELCAFAPLRDKFHPAISLWLKFCIGLAVAFTEECLYSRPFAVNNYIESTSDQLPPNPAATILTAAIAAVSVLNGRSPK